jgi:hypothetical protein
MSLMTERLPEQALDPLLQKIQRTDPGGIPAVAQAIQALPAKLTDAQAQEALDAMLQQISQTTDSHTLEELAQATQALTPKLTEAQVEQVVDPLLQKIGSTTSAETLES